MPEKTSYQQPQPEEHLTIASLHLQGLSMRAMALAITHNFGHLPLLTIGPFC